MKYYISKTVSTDFDKTVSLVKEALKRSGFGVLSEIDIHEKLKEKLDVDFRRYKILGACNPQYAYKALLKEDKIGTMLPCNVIVQELGENKTEVAAIDPVASMMAVETPGLETVAGEVKAMLTEVVNSL